MTRLTRRRFGFGAGILAGALVLSACATDAGGNEGTDAGGNGGSETITLTVQSWLVGDDPTTVGPTMKEIDEMFMAANPGVIIEHVGLPFDNYFALLRGQIAARGGPDVVMTFTNSTTLEFQNGLLGMGEYYSPEERTGLVGFKYGTDTQKIDGEPYVTPLLSEGNLMYFNKARVTECGADPDNIPREWDDFVAVLEQCKEAGVIPMNLGMLDGFAASWYIQNGTAQLLTEEELRQSAEDPSFPVDNAGTRWAFETIRDLQERGLYTPGAEGITVFSEARNNFAAGQAAFHFGNFSEGGKLYQEPLGDDLGVALFPSIPGNLYGDFVVAGPGVGWSITNWSETPDLAAEYIKFTQSQEPQQMLFDKGGELPANSATAPASEFPAVQQIIDYLALPDNHLGMSLSAEAGAVLWRNGTVLLLGNITPADLLAEMQAAQDIATQ